MKMYEMLSLYFQHEPCKESCFRIIGSLDLEHISFAEQSTKLWWRQTERLQARRIGLFAFRVNWIKTEEFGNDKLILTGLQSKRCHKKLVTPRGCECKADRPPIAEKVCLLWTTGSNCHNGWHRSLHPLLAANTRRPADVKLLCFVESISGLFYLSKLAAHWHV